MKKVYDWNIKILVYLPQTRQSVNLNVSIFTSFHELGIKLSNELGYEYLLANYDFVIKNQKYPPKPTENLRQMNIKSGQVIVAKFSTKPHQPYGITQYPRCKVELGKKL